MDDQVSNPFPFALCDKQKSSIYLKFSPDPVPVWSRPYKGQVRLINSNLTQTSSGRVEVYQKRQWGTVCASAMSQGAADSVCRQLGFTNALEIGVSSELVMGIRGNGKETRLERGINTQCLHELICYIYV